MTEELRLATGASTPAARKTKIYVLISVKEGIVKGVYTVFEVFYNLFVPPPPVKIQKFRLKSWFLPPPPAETGNSLETTQQLESSMRPSETL